MIQIACGVFLALVAFWAFPLVASMPLILFGCFMRLFENYNTKYK